MNKERSVRILCIEDNPVNYRLVQRLLSQEGFEMHWAEEGTAGLDLALQVKPDLILMDINLPGLSGFELTTKFRNYPEFKDIPIIALTAKTQRSDRETALVAGCNGFIPKPIDPFTFVSQVENYLEGHQERLDKSTEDRALRKFNVHLLEQLEQQLHEARESNKKLQETQKILEATNKSLTRLVALSQSIMREYDTWNLLKKVLNSLILEVPCDSFVMYLQHPSSSYWEGLCLAEGEFEQATVLPDDHPFIQKLLDLETADGWIQGAALLATPIWTDGYQLDIWRHSGQPCLVLYLDRKNRGALRGFWGFDRASGRPFLPLEFEIVKLYGRLAQVCHENAEMIQEMDKKNKALETSYEHLEHAYQELSRAKSELQEKDRQEAVKDLFAKTANHLKEPASILSQCCHVLLRSVQSDDDSTVQALMGIGQAANEIEAVLQGLLRRTQSETVSLPEWIDLESLSNNEITFMEIEGLMIAGQMQRDIDLSGARIYGIHSDFTRLLRTMVMNSIPSPETLSLPRHFRAWREEGTVHLQIQDSSGQIHPIALERAFEPFQGQREPLPGVRAPHPGLPLCRQTLATYSGSIDMKNTDAGALLEITIALGV
jgi:CheY-like chemotaxis protein